MAEKKKTRALTPKQERFVAEYVKNGGNATEAAKKAYPEQDEKSVHTQGWENLQKPALAEAIRREFARQGVTLEKALRPITKGLEAKTITGADDLTKQMMAHDRWLKASTFGQENGVQLNIGEAKGIEIKFTNLEAK